LELQGDLRNEDVCSAVEGSQGRGLYAHRSPFRPARNLRGLQLITRPARDEHVAMIVDLLTPQDWLVREIGVVDALEVHCEHAVEILSTIPAPFQTPSIEMNTPSVESGAAHRLMTA